MMCEGVPVGWARTEAGATAGVTGVAVPSLNGVVVASEHAEPEVIAALLDEVEADGVPYCLQGRPAVEAVLAEVASSRGMVREEYEVPLMVYEGPPGMAPERPPTGLVIRVLRPEEARIHAEVAAAGFEAPAEFFEQLMTPASLERPDVRAYVGEVGGQRVTTGLAVRVGTAVGVFNIGTPPDHRRRGYAGAITARIVEDALGDGAGWAWLQSSDVGYGTYERLGFHTLESWSCWVVDESDAS